MERIFVIIFITCVLAFSVFAEGGAVELEGKIDSGTFPFEPGNQTPGDEVIVEGSIQLWRSLIVSTLETAPVPEVGNGDEWFSVGSNGYVSEEDSVDVDLIGNDGNGIHSVTIPYGARISAQATENCQISMQIAVSDWLLDGYPDYEVPITMVAQTYGSDSIKYAQDVRYCESSVIDDTLIVTRTDGTQELPVAETNLTLVGYTTIEWSLAGDEAPLSGEYTATVTFTVQD